MNSFFSVSVSWSQGLMKSAGQGVRVASCGTRPIFFWFSKMRSRSASYPSSNRCIASILSTHSLVG